MTFCDWLTSHWLTYGLSVVLTNWLADRLKCSLSEWLTGWWIDWQTVWRRSHLRYSDTIHHLRSDCSPFPQDWPEVLTHNSTIKRPKSRMWSVMLNKEKLVQNREHFSNLRSPDLQRSLPRCKWLVFPNLVFFFFLCWRFVVMTIMVQTAHKPVWPGVYLHPATWWAHISYIVVSLTCHMFNTNSVCGSIRFSSCLFKERVKIPIMVSETRHWN